MTRPTRRSFRMSLLAAAFALSAYGTAGPAEQAAATRTTWPPDRLNNLTDWGVYRGDKRATQYSSISQINTTNVHRLTVAWQYNHGLPEGPGIYSNAIIVDGLLYFTTPRVNVIALDAATGKEVWRFDPAPYTGGRIFRGRNRGVTYWEDEHGRNQRIFAFVRDRVYAIDAKTGALIEPFGQAGGQFIDLRRDLPVRSELADIEVTTPGTVFENYLIVTSRVPEGHTSTPGDIRAYNAATGKFEWIFNTIPREGQFGYDTWKFEPNMHYGGANVWGGVTVDEQRGWVFAAPGSAAGEFIYGGSRKGDNLFANTVLALNARTGERIWHYQIIRHDIWDYDTPSAPTLFDIERDGETIPALVQATKQGFLFVLDRRTGEPLFPIEERATPPSTAEGEVTAPTQPFAMTPAPVGRPLEFPGVWALADIVSFGQCSRDRERYLYEGIFTPPSEQGTLFFPGTAGATNWGGVAVDPRNAILYVNASRIVQLIRLIPRAEYDQIDTSASGNEEGYSPQEGSPYGIHLTDWSNWAGMPCWEPPFGTFSAIDLSTGELLYERPFGRAQLEGFYGLESWGSPTLGGPVVTAGGVVFIGASVDSRVRALDAATGQELWSDLVDAPAVSIPAVFTHQGVDYVVFAVGGNSILKPEVSDQAVAYRLNQ